MGTAKRSRWLPGRAGRRPDTGPGAMGTDRRSEHDPEARSGDEPEAQEIACRLRCRARRVQTVIRLAAMITSWLSWRLALPRRRSWYHECIRGVLCFSFRKREKAA